VLTGVVFGLAPAFRTLKVDLNSALKSGGRSTQGEGGLGLSHNRLRGLLVVSELAFSLMLLIGAGLLIRSFARLQAVPPGFNPDHVISMRLGSAGRRFENENAAIQFYKQLLDRVGSVPGVLVRGSASNLPFTSAVGWGGISVEGFPPQPGQEIQADFRNASTDYFRTMEIPLLRGRFFDDHDLEPGAQQVVLIDDKFAQRFWPKEDPIGKHVWFDPKKPLTIAGVVGTVKQYGLDAETKIVVYVPGSGSYIVARTSSDPAAVASAVVKEIHNADRSIPVFEIRTMQDRMSDSMARQRFSTIMLGAFSVFALILAAIGVYGVMSYLVTQSRHDIGLRIALGAQRGRILWLVVRQGMELALAGIVLGIGGAFALTRLMSSLLFRVSAVDVLTFSTVPLMLAAVALAATYVPAYRATQVDPMMVLREE
jgi:predicted permease